MTRGRQILLSLVAVCVLGALLFFALLLELDWRTATCIKELRSEQTRPSTLAKCLGNGRVMGESLLLQIKLELQFERDAATLFRTMDEYKPTKELWGSVWPKRYLRRRSIASLSAINADAHQIWRWQQQLLRNNGAYDNAMWARLVEDLCGSRQGCGSTAATMNRLSSTLAQDLRNVEAVLNRYRELCEGEGEKYEAYVSKYPRTTEGPGGDFRVLCQLPSAFKDAQIRDRLSLLSSYARFITAERAVEDYLDPLPSPISVSPFAPSPLLDKVKRTAATIDFPATVLILRQVGLDRGSASASGTDLQPYCSGTLIAPDVVLTAAHCVCGVRTDSDVCRKRFDQAKTQTPHGSVVPNSYLVFVQGIGTRRIAPRGPTVHPSYTSYRQFPDGTSRTKADLAILQLAEPVLAVTPAFLLPSDEAVLREDPALLVGFGGHFSFAGRSGLATGLMGEGAKLHALASIAPCCADLLEWQGMFSGAAADSSMLGSTCPGDSGGPIFGGAWHADPTLANDLRVVGVASFAASTECREVNLTYWTDVRPYRPWIDPFVTSSLKRHGAKWFRALAPVFNSDQTLLTQEGSKVAFHRDGVKSADLGFSIPAPGDGTLSVTVNASCPSATSGVCAATAMSLAVVSTSSDESCRSTTRSVVLQCSVVNPKSQTWRVQVQGYLTPLPRVELQEAQDVQIAVYWRPSPGIAFSSANAQ